LGRFSAPGGIHADLAFRVNPGAGLKPSKAKPKGHFMKRTHLACVIACVLAAPAWMAGCDREISHTGSATVDKDGSSKSQETVVRERSDGAIIKEETKTKVDDDGDAVTREKTTVTTPGGTVTTEERKTETDR